ncbi:hypothetical protein E2C01_005461 [Portunus trituberculatus]|uniref:Uncharacterized protein n=1 Tax=Portunus trituberculatus TaxID=210409 RepID=A0A5B7CVL4_PORTR|nr:hypothetical protein [Portunus trituberculatus]
MQGPEDDAVGRDSPCAHKSDWSIMEYGSQAIVTVGEKILWPRSCDREEEYKSTELEQTNRCTGSLIKPAKRKIMAFTTSESVQEEK